MPNLNFQVIGAEPQPGAAEPLMLFNLRVSETLSEGTPPTPIQSVALRCQVRIEPARRRYTDSEQSRLLDLFGTPDRWGQTLRPMPWRHLSINVPPFTGSGSVALPVPCSFDFSLAVTKYFAALEQGDLPLAFLFSGTIFYKTPDGALQVTQIPWDKEASFRLPAATWQALIDRYYPNSAWLRLPRDIFDRLDHYRSRQALPSFECALERLLTEAEAEAVAP